MTMLAPAPALGGTEDPFGRAARVQHALATTHRASVGGVSAACDVRSALRVGGDFVDLIDCGDKLVAVLGDVSGKGPASSLIAATVLGLLQHHVHHIGAEPATLLRALADSVSGVLDRTGALVTVAVGAIDTRTGELRIASAGHHPVLLRTGGGFAGIPATSAPLGAAAPAGVERRMPFPAGSSLVIVSDGVTDETDVFGREFGLGGVAEALAVADRGEPEAMVSRVLEAVNRHAGPTRALDDRAVLVAAA